MLLTVEAHLSFRNLGLILPQWMFQHFFLLSFLLLLLKMPILVFQFELFLDLLLHFIIKLSQSILLQLLASHKCHLHVFNLIKLLKIRIIGRFNHFRKLLPTIIYLYKVLVHQRLVPLRTLVKQGAVNIFIISQVTIFAPVWRDFH